MSTEKKKLIIEQLLGGSNETHAKFP